ncbi:MAG TPA: glycosyltransferase [Acidobacteria bacterium]|nr:glycosyltransferase [Acidobacteriota bacterium]
MASPTISIVIPVFNEEPNLHTLWERLRQSMSPFDAEGWEVIMVDDGSKDQSLSLLKSIAQHDEHLIVIEFNRNYGQHAAIMQGFQTVASSTQYVITLDADLQNPPEDIPRLITELKKGYEVVGGVRRTRAQNDSFWRRWPSKLVNYVTRKTTGVALTDYGCMLRGYTKSVVEAMLSCDEKSTFIPVLANTFAKSITEVDVGHAPRLHGDSKYGLLALIRLQFDLTTGFSTFPLQMLSGIGILISVGSLGLGIYLLIMRLLGFPDNTNGVFTLFALVFLILGILFLGLGILGEYIGRIYSQVRVRPRSIVKHIHRKTN